MIKIDKVSNFWLFTYYIYIYFFIKFDLPKHRKKIITVGVGKTIQYIGTTANLIETKEY